MSRYSGKNGTATWDGSAVSEVLSWDLDRTSNNEVYHSSEAAGDAMQRVATTKDWTATLTVGSMPACDEGDSAELVLYDNTKILTGTGIVNSVTHRCNINGELVEWTITVVANDSEMVESSGSYSPS